MNMESYEVMSDKNAMKHNMFRARYASPSRRRPPRASLCSVRSARQASAAMAASVAAQHTHPCAALLYPPSNLLCSQPAVTPFWSANACTRPIQPHVHVFQASGRG